MLETALAETALREFIEQAWHVVEPKTPFIGGWHIDAICDHLEAVSRHEITRLIINIPPRCMKSLTVSVFWPCYTWISAPHIRWLFSSYAETLSKRDSLKCRRLIQSRWYQERWGDRFQITSDQNEKLRFENDKTGIRIATSVDGLGTGEGGDYIVVDDPHNVRQAESEAKRISTLQWWDESMSTRLNNERTGGKVIVMQRVHDQDLTGHVLEREMDYVHLKLPMRFEKDNRCTTVIGFQDPRTEEGDLLWKERMPKEAVDKREGEMTPYAIASQEQQRPSPRGGGLFKVENFKIVGAFNRADITRSVRYWDKAGTEGDGAFTVGVLMHKMVDDTYLVEDVRREQLSALNREKLMKQTAQIDGPNARIWVEQEPGSGGKESAQASVRNLAGFVVAADRVNKSKEARAGADAMLKAESYSAQVEAGNVKLLQANWNRAFIDEHEPFPMGKFKDQVDAASGAFNKLQVGVVVAGTWDSLRRAQAGRMR